MRLSFYSVWLEGSNRGRSTERNEGERGSEATEETPDGGKAYRHTVAGQWHGAPEGAPRRGEEGNEGIKGACDRP
jgi:hypothetical protein